MNDNDAWVTLNHKTGEIVTFAHDLQRSGVLRSLLRAANDPKYADPELARLAHGHLRQIISERAMWYGAFTDKAKQTVLTLAPLLILTATLARHFHSVPPEKILKQDTLAVLAQLCPDQDDNLVKAVLEER